MPDIHAFRTSLRTAVVSLILVPVAALPGAARTVTLCDSENPPYSVGAEDGTSADGGVAVELASRVFAQIEGVDLDVRLMPWSRCLQAARTGQVDGVLKLLYNEERAEYLEFTKQPIYKMDVVLFYLAESHPDGLSWSSIEDLRGMTVGTVSGASAGTVIDTAIRDGILRSDDAANDEQTLRKVAGKRVDFVADNRIMGLANVKALGLSGQIKATEQTVSSQPILIGLSKASDERALLPEIDRILGQFWEDGTAEQILAGAE